MVEINLAPAPRCKFEKCNEIAEFEFTDVVLADKDKKMKDRVLICQIKKQKLVKEQGLKKMLGSIEMAELQIKLKKGG